MENDRLIAWMWPLIAVAGGGLSLIHFEWGAFNQDEGWYLYAAQLLAEGQRPYTDFGFTQGPVFLWVYQAALPFVERWGVGGGRLFTALFGVSGVLLAAWLTARLVAGPWARGAAFMTAALLWCNVYHSYYTLVVKTYALSSVLLLGGALGLVSVFRNRRIRGAFWAGALFALAAGVRLSLGIWLPVAGLSLWVARSRWPRAWCWFGAGGGVGLLLVFGPALYRDPSAAWFWLVTYHTAREGGQSLLYPLGFLSRWVQAYSAVLLLGWGAVWGRGFSGLKGKVFWGDTVMVTLWVGCGVLTAVHAVAPFPYDDYQVALMPLFTALVVAGLVQWLNVVVVEARQPIWSAGTAVIVCGIAGMTAFSSPLNQALFVRGRDGIWWPVKEQSDARVLRDTGNWLAGQAGPDDKLLTQDLYVAVQAGLRVPAGLEMGPFAFYPEWSEEQAGRYGVLNRAAMEQLIRSGVAEWAAVSAYGWSIAAPDIVPLAPEERAYWLRLINEEYEHVKTVPYFGQAQGPLHLYRRRTP